MVWNWAQHGWPHFAYDPVALEPLERRFLLLTGEVIGAVRHVSVVGASTIARRALPRSFIVLLTNTRTCWTTVSSGAA